MGLYKTYLAAPSPPPAPIPGALQASVVVCLLFLCGTLNLVPYRSESKYNKGQLPFTRMYLHLLLILVTKISPYLVPFALEKFLKAKEKCLGRTLSNNLNPDVVIF